MNYQTCPVYDCCGGTIIRDNGMRARCRNCNGRGVVEAPGVTPATGYADGIREGERRMLWAIAVGAHLDRDRHMGWMDVAGLSDYYRGVVQKLQEARDVALCTLRDAGDESALRLLGERGW